MCIICRSQSQSHWLWVCVCERVYVGVCNNILYSFCQATHVHTPSRIHMKIVCNNKSFCYSLSYNSFASRRMLLLCVYNIYFRVIFHIRSFILVPCYTHTYAHIFFLSMHSTRRWEDKRKRFISFYIADNDGSGGVLSYVIIESGTSSNVVAFCVLFFNSFFLGFQMPCLCLSSYSAL